MKKYSKVLVIHHDINWSWKSFKVVSPTLERFEDGQEFFIIDVIIQFCRVEGLGVKGNWMNLIIRWSDCRENGTESVV